MNVPKYDSCAISSVQFDLNPTLFFVLSRSGNNGNMAGGYRGGADVAPGNLQQNYGPSSYRGVNVMRPQSYFGQPPAQMGAQMYHQSMPNAYTQMAPMARPMHPPQPMDTRAYGQPAQHQLPMQNRS